MDVNLTGKPFNPEKMFNEFYYGNYKFNRDKFPHVPAKQWEAVFGNFAKIMEVRYQREIK
jgi:hypothetical protein